VIILSVFKKEQQMPRYLQSHAGEYVNSVVRIPKTLNHMTEFLSRVDLDNWAHVQNAATLALEGGVKLPRKIKPSSLRAITDNKAFHLITPILNEHIGHNDHTQEIHTGGGIKEAVGTALQVTGGIVGGQRVNEWVSGETPHRKRSPQQIMLAKLVDATYETRRPEEVGNWTRIDDYDSRYGAIWKNPQSRYVLAVRGTKGSLKDIWKNFKIFLGSSTQSDDDLVKTLQKFKHDHPETRLDVAAHSLGTMLAWNANKHGELSIPGDYSFFSPASSPFQRKEAIREILDSPRKIDLFLNKNDAVSNYFSQNLRPQDMERVYYAPFSRNPITSHKMGQWIVENY
jgi:hypothetical protein